MNDFINNIPPDSVKVTVLQYFWTNHSFLLIMARILISPKDLQLTKFGVRLLTIKLDQPRLLEECSQDQEDSTIAPAIRYNVCREKGASAPQKYQFPRSPSEDQAAKMENADNFSNFPESPATLENIKSDLLPVANGYRQFEASSTYKNLVLPLKASKLSDPFPSPVKIMPSHTVSDQEKADQMMAERRIPRNITKKNC